MFGFDEDVAFVEQYVLLVLGDDKVLVYDLQSVELLGDVAAGQKYPREPPLADQLEHLIVADVQSLGLQAQQLQSVEGHYREWLRAQEPDVLVAVHQDEVHHVMAVPAPEPHNLAFREVRVP